MGNQDNPVEDCLVQSHFEGEVWGLEVVPGQNKVLTSGDDNKVMMYDFETRMFERKGTVSDHKSASQAKIKAATASSMSIYPPNQQARAICYSLSVISTILTAKLLPSRTLRNGVK